MMAQRDADDRGPSCPICDIRMSVEIDHPAGRFFCESCATIFSGGDIEWAENRFRRQRHKEWKQNEERERLAQGLERVKRRERAIAEADVMPDRWRDRGDLT